MAGSGKKWLAGCGIGCGLLILIAGGVGTCGYFAVKDVAERAESVEEGFDALADNYGRPGEFVPRADGTIPTDRLEMFLAVREDMAASRAGLALVLTNLDADTRGPGGVIAKIRSGITLVPSLFDFIDDRNAALTERGMGLGEYVHIYSVAYYAWLGEDPADGPDFAFSSNEDDREGPVHISLGDDSDTVDVRERRDQEIRTYLHGIQRSILGNQLTVAETAGLDPAWITTLREEAGAMDRAPRRLLWEDDLPAPLRASLEPYRERLAASYTPVMNVVEIGLVKNE